MRQRLFSPTDYPHGHPEIAWAMFRLGWEWYSLADYSTAELWLKQAVAMNEALYPSASYPDGHPDLAGSLSLLGKLDFDRGDPEAAASFFCRANDMQQVSLDALYWAASAAEAMNFASSASRLRNYLISVWPSTSMSPSELYARIWRQDGAVARAFAERQHIIAGGSGETIGLFKEYASTKRQLARLALAGAESDGKRMNERHLRLQELSDTKERLERELATIAPEVAHQQSAARRPHTDLGDQLSKSSAFIQLVRYAHEEPGSATGASASQVVPAYAAFVLAPNQRVTMVHLGSADPIDAAVTAWRQAIVDDLPSEAASALRRLVWDPIEGKLPPGTDTVYQMPEGPLTALPWAALPGKKPGTVLLEDYALALVPYGPFLLDQLTAPERPASADDMLFAVGGVAYDKQPAAPSDAAQLAALRGEVGLDGPRVRWPELPGTQSEVDALAKLAGNRPANLLTRSEASTARVLAELPRARWAVFATHGFFADPKFRSALQLDESIFEKRDFLFGGERTTPVGRNPLLLSGLVLAGANLPRPNDEFGIPLGDGGILSAEQIAGLPLDKLELVVLSACDTGLGEVAGGEGVFGLQRAFHQAGAANVVASLWKIDDQATAALMRLFYFKLFHENKPPLAALREAQLAIYHHPEQIGPLASARAPEFGNKVKLVDGGKSKTSNGRAATRLWAGFVLSGAGR